MKLHNAVIVSLKRSLKISQFTSSSNAILGVKIQTKHYGVIFQTVNQKTAKNYSKLCILGLKWKLPLRGKIVKCLIILIPKMSRKSLTNNDDNHETKNCSEDQNTLFSLLENSFNFCDSWVRWRFQIHSWPVRPAQIRVTEQPACPGYHKIGHIFTARCSVHPKHLQLSHWIHSVLIQMPRLFGVTTAADDDSLPAEHLLKGL